MADLASPAAAVGVVGPGRLDGEAARAQGDVLRGPGAGTDPRALVAVLVARAVDPAGRRVWVGQGLGVLMTLHDRDAVKHPSCAVVDVPLAASFAGI